MLLLASKSPRRRELLALITPHFEVEETHFDEAGMQENTPLLLAGRLGAEKAKVAFARRPQDVVIGCDTVVELQGRALGKPRSRLQAVEMLQALSGEMHQVHTGVCVFAPGTLEPLSFTETTEVYFSSIPKEEIEAYVDTDEPYDKAGGYGIQGWAARFVPRINGCYYNVMGLPVPALYQRLHQMGAV